MRHFLKNKGLYIALIGTLFIGGASVHAQIPSNVSFVPPPPNLGDSIVCVGNPPANPNVTLHWGSHTDDAPSTSVYSENDGRYVGQGSYNGFVYPGPNDMWTITDTNMTYRSPLEYVIIFENGSTYGDPIYPPGYGIPPFNLGGFSYNVTSATDANCDSRIFVNVVDTNNVPVSGASWTVQSTPGGESMSAVDNWVRPNSGGSNYTLTNVIVPSGYTLQSISNSDGGGTVMNTTPGATKTFTITLLPNPVTPPVVNCTISAGADPVYIQSGQSATLTWSSEFASAVTASASPANSNWTGSKPLNGSQSTGPLTVTTTFTIDCSGPGGETDTDSVTVNVISGPPAPPTGVNATTGSTCGGEILLTWNASPGATSYLVFRNGVQVATVTGTSYVDGGLTPGASYSYFVRASNTAGTSANSLTDAANASGACPAGPTVNLTATPDTLNAGGGSTTLTWTVSNATSCTASGGWSGSRAPSGGSQAVTVTNTTTFVLTCIDAFGNSSNDSVTVSVSAGPGVPTVDISASRINLGTSGNVTLTWTVSNADSCVASASPANGGWTGPRSTAGGSQSVAVSQTTTFTLTCSNAIGQAEDSVLVTVSNNPPFDYTLQNLTGNPSVARSASGNVSTQVQIRKNPVSGVQQPVNITAENLPSSVSVGYTNRTCNPICTTTLTLTVSPSAPVGSWTITVRGTSAGVADKTLTFTLTITDPSAMTVTCSVSPLTTYIGQPVTWTANVSGGTPPYSYFWTGTEIVGGPTVNPYVHTYSLIGAKTASVVVSDGNGVVAQCPQNSVQISIDPNYREF